MSAGGGTFVSHKTHYARLGHATQHLLPSFLQEVLLQFENPNHIYINCSRNRFLSRRLKPGDWEKLKHAVQKGYFDFDIPLIYSILRNLHDPVARPTRGWEHPIGPLVNEIGIGDDMERCCRIRKEIIHRGNTRVNDQELKQYFYVFRTIADRLEKFCRKYNNEFVLEVDHLATCCMDEATELRYLDDLTDYQKEKDKENGSKISDLELKRSAIRITGSSGDVKKRKHTLINLRQYQEELAEIALSGKNTIICAGTNSGKTYIAFHIIEDHLIKHPEGKVAFINRTNILLGQQYERACDVFSTLFYQRKINIWKAEEDDNEYFIHKIHNSSLMFLTPQSLSNHLTEKANTPISIAEFTLIILDECHHTFDNSDYNKLMAYYRKAKYEEKLSSLPQILGLTASPGTKKVTDLNSAKHHLRTVMTNLAVSKLSIVKRNEEELLQYTTIPEKVFIRSNPRPNDPLKDIVILAMNYVESMFNCRKVLSFLIEHMNDCKDLYDALNNPPKQRSEIRYIQWIAETKDKVEHVLHKDPKIPRLLHACFRHLELYAECLEVNSLLEVDQVCNVITQGYADESAASQNAKTEEETEIVNKLKEVFVNIREIGRKIEKNPDVKALIELLDTEYRKCKEDSRFLIFVKTRATARALVDVLPDYLRSTYLTGSHKCIDEDGLPAAEQIAVLDNFRNGDHLCVVATSVASEGFYIPLCNLMIRYRFRANEISSLQMRGKVRRSKQGKEVHVGTFGEFETEEKNIQRQYLMAKAIEDVCELYMDKANAEKDGYQLEEMDKNCQIQGGKNIHLPWLDHAGEFQSMLSNGDYLSYDNRLSLGGPCKAGKSTLASLLIGNEIPLNWNSTDGVVIYFGKNGIDIREKKMVPLGEGQRGHEVFAKIIRGKPDVSNRSQISTRGQTSTSLDSSSQADITTSQLAKTDMTEGQMAITNSTHHSVFQHCISQTESVLKDTSILSHRAIFLTTNEIKTLECGRLQIQSDILEEVRNGQYRIEIAPSDLIDFGGQKSYDMTHQLFIQHSGTFLLMFDGRFGLHTQLGEYPEGVTAASILKHWVDSILTYTEDTKDCMPMIMFAATHRDLCKDDIVTMKENFTRDVIDMFSKHENRNHIFLDTVYFITGIDENDSEIQRMTDQVVMFAMKQSSWGQRRPMQWVPLELQLSNMRTKNINIVTREDLQNVNKLNDDLALNESELENFLFVQHSLGKLIYYNLPGLNNHIIVHPPALVNILRSFVTDEMFFPADQCLTSILQTMTMTGKIYKKDLFKLWQQDPVHRYMPDNTIKEFVIQLLTHLDILIIPKGAEQNSSSSDVYIVPCTIKATRPSDFYLVHSMDERIICLRYTLARHSIPTALAYKIIGTAINSWPLKYEHQKPCLYHKASVLNVSEDNELRIWIEDNRVMVCMTNKNSLLSISPNIAASVQECLTRNIESSLLFHCKSFGRKITPIKVVDLYTIEVGIPCGSNICFIPSKDVLKIDSWKCDKGRKHDTRYLRYWVFDKTQKMCVHGCEGLTTNELGIEPNDKHLVRLGGQIGIKLFEEFFISLGMNTKQWENIAYTYDGHSSEGIMSMALTQWRNTKLSKMEKPTLKDLTDALRAVDLDSHLICQFIERRKKSSSLRTKVFRENTTLFEIEDINLQAIPSDQHLKELSNQIGNCPLQLGIELGLSFTDVDQSLFSFPKDLSGLVEDILKKWKKNSKVKTIHSLMLALERVNAGGIRYLYDLSKKLADANHADIT